MDKPAEESGQEAAVQRTTPWTTFAPVSNVSSSVSGTVAKTSSTLTHLLQTQNGNNNHTVVSFNSVQLLMINQSLLVSEAGREMLYSDKEICR